MQNRRLVGMIWAAWIVGFVYLGTNFWFEWTMLGWVMSMSMNRNHPKNEEWPWVRPWNPHTNASHAVFQRITFTLSVICVFLGALSHGVAPKSIWLGSALLFWLASGRRYPAHAPAPVDV